MQLKRIKKERMILIMKRSKRIDWSMIRPILGYSLILIVVLFFTIAPAVNKVVDKREVIVTVVDKGIKNHDRKSQYLIYCIDGNQETQVYQITDSILKMRFDSSDVYPNIIEGKTYKFTVCGKRVHMLSWYPNIYQLEEMKE